MDKFEEVYVELMPIATSLGVGYEAAQGDLLKAIRYSIITAMFLGENIFRGLGSNSANSKILEEIQ